MLESSTLIMSSGATRRAFVECFLLMMIFRQCSQKRQFTVRQRRPAVSCQCLLLGGQQVCRRRETTYTRCNFPSLFIAQERRFKAPYSLTNLPRVRPAITQDKPLLLFLSQIVRR